MRVLSRLFNGLLVTNCPISSTRDFRLSVYSLEVALLVPIVGAGDAQKGATKMTNEEQRAYKKVMAFRAELVDPIPQYELSTVLRHILAIIDHDYHQSGADADIQAAIDKIDTPY